MKVDRLPPSVLNGKFLHCQPVENGQIVEAQIIPTDGQLPTARVVIVCPVRIPGSKCKLRMKTEEGNQFCIWYKGDSLGDYQVIGLGMVNKLEGGYK